MLGLAIQPGKHVRVAVTAENVSLHRSTALIGFSFESSEAGAHEMLGLDRSSPALPVSETVAVTRSSEGHISITTDRDVGSSSPRGSWAELLVSTIIAGPEAGIYIGISLAILWSRLVELGMSATWMQGVADSVLPGGCAMFLIVEPVQSDEHVDLLAGRYGLVNRATATHQIFIPSGARDELEAQFGAARSAH